MTQVASETISALKTSPLLLVVVVLNAGMIAALLYVANLQRDERQMLIKYAIETCGGPAAGPRSRRNVMAGWDDSICAEVRWATP